MPDPIKPTAADLKVAAEIVRWAFPDLVVIGAGSSIEAGELDDHPVVQIVAIHAQQAREQALEEAAKVADERQYATGLEWTPIAIARGIRALKEQQR